MPDFEDILHERHEIAENMSHILAQRQHQNEELRDAFRKGPDDSERAGHRAVILQRIRDFFGLP